MRCPPRGLEPRTNGLKVRCSTVELEGRDRLKDGREPPRFGPAPGGRGYRLGLVTPVAEWAAYEAATMHNDDDGWVSADQRSQRYRPVNLESVQWCRPAEIEALCIPDAEAADSFQFVLGLDALSQDFSAGVGSEHDERGDEGAADGVDVDAGYQLPVELDVVGSEFEDVGEAGVPGAGVIHSEPDAPPSQPLQSSLQAGVAYGKPCAR